MIVIIGKKIKFLVYLANFFGLIFYFPFVIIRHYFLGRNKRNIKKICKKNGCQLVSFIKTFNGSRLQTIEKQNRSNV